MTDTHTDGIRNEMDTIVVDAHGIVKSYPTPEGDLTVLDGLDIQVSRGEILAVTGESGSGKSTLLHLLGGLDRVTDGTIIVNGTDIGTLDGDALARFRNGRVGFVFQFHHLLPDFTALENVLMPAYMVGVDMKIAREKARELLATVGLSHRLSHRPSQLSGGEQQRTAFARALMNDPDLVLADEPSGNLDPRHSGQLHGEMLRLARDRGAAFIIATHDPKLSQLADREVKLSNGTVDTIPE
jgi:lipoprotein-releasing system ATP-binding protein